MMEIVKLQYACSINSYLNINLKLLVVSPRQGTKPLYSLGILLYAEFGYAAFRAVR